MPKWKKLSPKSRRISALLFDDFSNHCLANLIEPLRAANTLSGQRLYHWSHVSPDGRAVVSSSGLEIRPEAPLEFSNGDMLAVLPSYNYRAHARPQIARALQAAARRFPVLMGLDTGSWLLAEAGLLDQKQATIHWEELPAFTEAFPQVDARAERFVVDEAILSSAGAMATFDLMLHLIGEHHGTALQQDVAALLMVGEARPSSRLADRLVARALTEMRQSVETPMTIGALAARLGVSQKTLENRMKGALGATPSQVYKREKLILARKLVRETALSIAEISLRCGYQNPAALTRAFRSEFGTSPRAMRAA